MYRENKRDFQRVLREIQTKLPDIEKIEPVKFDNGQMMLKFWEKDFASAFYSPKMSDGTLKLLETLCVCLGYEVRDNHIGDRLSLVSVRYCHAFYDTAL